MNRGLKRFSAVARAAQRKFVFFLIITLIEILKKTLLDPKGRFIICDIEADGKLMTLALIPILFTFSLITSLISMGTKLSSEAILIYF